MDNSLTKKALFLILFSVGGIVAIIYSRSHRQQEESSAQYYSHQGYVFGTYYNIRYEAGECLEDSILQRLQEFDASLSTFNPKSTISVLNQGRDTVWDAYFTHMYETAQEIQTISRGAFDIRVAPLVNAWGFGFKNKEHITPELIDSLLQVKNILDASAIAKGYGCDVVANLLKAHGSQNYLVDIGGECVLQGFNQEGNAWRVGITKPVEDSTNTQNEIQEIIESTQLCMATSGNYRQFYYDGNVRRSHTIDPRTGYPAESDLLSATVVASSCMRADALATACMVLGSDSALQMIEQLDDAECYLIVAGQHDDMLIRTSAGFPLKK